MYFCGILIFNEIKSYSILKQNNQNQITRKDAIKKMGKYAGLTAIGTFLILNPTKAQANSAESAQDPGI